MSRMYRYWLVALVLSVGMLLPARAGAGWLLSHRNPDCPASSYSPCHYWTPTLYRLHVACHGPKLNVYAVDRFPDVPINYQITPYPCPAAPPSAIPYGAGDIGR
jgi:hypothetical protein